MAPSALVCGVVNWSHVKDLGFSPWAVMAVFFSGREFQKNIYFRFIDYTKAFHCVDRSKLRKILKEMGLPDHLTSLLRNRYTGQE